MNHPLLFKKALLTAALGIACLASTSAWAQTNLYTMPNDSSSTTFVGNTVSVGNFVVSPTDGSTESYTLMRDTNPDGSYASTGYYVNPNGQRTPITYNSNGSVATPLPQGAAAGTIVNVTNTPPSVVGQVYTTAQLNTTINNAIAAAVPPIAPQQPVIGLNTVDPISGGDGNQVIYGNNAAVNAPGGSAIGSNTTVAAGANNSTALGNGAVATRPNEVSVGNAATGSTSVISNVTAGTLGTDAVNVNQLTSGMATTLTAANSYTDTVAAATLASANSYTDGRLGDIPTGLTVAQHIANTAATTLASANTYTDQVAQTTLTSAQNFAISLAGVTLSQANTYTDQVAITTLNSANTYTDQVAITTLNSANHYTDQVAITTLNTANTYTDNRIGNIGNMTVQQYVTNSVAAGVTESKQYTDARVAETGRAANKGIASAIAMGAVNIAQHAGHFMLGAGVGSYGGEQAIAVKGGYLFESGKSSINLGISKSSGTTPTGVQAGFAIAF